MELPEIRYFSFLLLCIFYRGIVTAQDERPYMILDSDERVKFSWKFDGTQPSSEITFKVEVKTRGWVGLGLSPSGSMVDADLFIAWVDASGEVFLEDRHGTDSNGFPMLDDSNDLTLVNATEENGITTVAFKRKLNTCDKIGDRVITADTVRLIYAYGVNDPREDELSQNDHHGGRRGVVSVRLLDVEGTTDEEKVLPENAQTYDMNVNEVELPSLSTVYYCSFYKAPPVTSKHHIIAFDSILTRGNEELVHRALLYACINVSDADIKGNINETHGFCFTESMPAFYTSCRALTYAWAIGAKKFYVPEAAGIPIGDNEAPEYYMIEMHYSNPELKTGVIDSSGLRLTYTETLRENDAGFMMSGAIEGIIVPPVYSEFRNPGYCSSGCTSNWIPPSGVNLLAYGLHTHTLGRQVQVDLYKKDGTSTILASDLNYDFNYQQYMLFDSPKKLNPGDSLKITCTTDSSQSSTATYGGLSTDEEMCIAFFLYYPKQKISECSSYAEFAVDPTHQIYSVLGLPQENNSNRTYSFYDAYKPDLENVPWTTDMALELQHAVDKADHISKCSYTFTNRLPDDGSKILADNYNVLLPQPSLDICGEVPTTTPRPTTALKIADKLSSSTTPASNVVHEHSTPDSSACQMHSSVFIITVFCAGFVARLSFT